MISCTFWEKTWLAAHSGKKHGWQPDCAVNHFFPECTANHVFPRMCCQSGFFSQNVLPIMIFFPECAADHGFCSTFW
jgi:hypothetical protein